MDLDLHRRHCCVNSHTASIRCAGVVPIHSSTTGDGAPGRMTLVVTERAARMRLSLSQRLDVQEPNPEGWLLVGSQADAYRRRLNRTIQPSGEARHVARAFALGAVIARAVTLRVEHRGREHLKLAFQHAVGGTTQREGITVPLRSQSLLDSGHWRHGAYRGEPGVAGGLLPCWPRFQLVLCIPRLTCASLWTP